VQTQFYEGHVMCKLQFVRKNWHDGCNGWNTLAHTVNQCWL